MASRKSVNIKLTAKQQTQLRQLTGETHKTIKFERTKSGLTGKRALASKVAMRPGIAWRLPG